MREGPLKHSNHRHGDREDKAHTLAIAPAARCSRPCWPTWRRRATSGSSATLLTTQVDFTYAGNIMAFIDEEQIESLERQMSKTGFLKGQVMAETFSLLRSNDLIWPM